ncbi:MAG: hypothetical protein EXR98_12285 [Gemmataceae bacterium]|nr:hypothetical protein [Gemmataceae bacterium]
MKISTMRICASLLLLAGAAQFASAQVITNAEIERGLRYRGNASFDGEPYTQRYSYSTGAPFAYLNGDSRQHRYLDYLDRVDRAEKFGYRMPIDPYFDGPPPEPSEPVMVHPTVRAGIGFGIFRRR